MRVELRIEAREDLAEGAAFYDRQRPGPGIIRLSAFLPAWKHFSRLAPTRDS